MKRKFLSVLLTAFLVSTIALTGCSSSSSSSTQSSSSSNSTSSSGEKASIIVWTNFDNEAETLQKYAESWSKETGNEAKVIHQTPDVQKFAQAAKSADGPDAVFGIANDQLASFVSAGLVAEVPDDVYSDSDYTEASVKSCYIDGKKYAVPIAVETTALFYNTEKIKTPPTTWDELIEQAKANGGIQFEATSIYYDIGFLEAFGGYIFKYDKEKKEFDVNDIGLDNDGSVKAYEYLQKLALDYKFFSSDITSDIAKSNFQNGKTAFYIGGPWDVQGFASANTPFKVTTLPKLNGNDFVTTAGIQVGFVSKSSDSQDAVWDFFKYLMKNAPQELYSVGSRIPASISEQEKVNADDNTKAFIQQIENSEPLPTLAELNQIWTPYSDNMQLLFSGKITPEKAASNIQSQFKEGIELMNSGK